LGEVVLSIKNLSKSYGHVKAIQNLNLEVEKGSVFGILGPNGSGKTTTLGILLDVLKADDGEYSWFGKTPSHESRKRIGSILEQPLFYPYLTAANNLKLITDIKERGDYKEIDEKLKLVGLYERKHSKFKTFSYGMKQRLALAAALLGKPEVLILDEPTNGLDPQGIADIRNLISDIASRGITIVLASHLLDEVQKTCTHVAVLEEGKKLFSGNVAEVLNETMHIEVAADDMQRLKILLEECENVLSITEKKGLFHIKVTEGFNGTNLNKYLFSKDITANHLLQQKKSLENYFLELLKNS